MILAKKGNKLKFAVYGLGVTGISVINYLKKLNLKNLYTWDDRRENRLKFKTKISLKDFSKRLNEVDYIVMSPGISLNKTKIKRQLLKNRKKIITDLDLLYLHKPNLKSIVVTGTNGKSTTCKIIEHLLKKKFNVQLGGNIGKPVLNLKNRKKTIFVIEASSFQLAYSKFVKPKYALILNIKNDHLDWHGDITNYINSKFKIFSLQTKKDYAFLNNKKLINKFRHKKNSGKIVIVSRKFYKKIENKIDNTYLRSPSNIENMSFVYGLSKVLKIKDSYFIKSLKNFKGLPHRNETFYEKNNLKIVNDSKATSFEASKYAIKENSNIFWIVGGLPKLGDKFKLKNLKKNIIKSYIIGKNINYFKKQLKGQVIFQSSKTIKNALISIFKEIKKNPKKKYTVLFSPASASYDQYRNFEERGNIFKKFIKLYASKFI